MAVHKLHIYEFINILTKAAQNVYDSSMSEKAVLWLVVTGNKTLVYTWE